MQWKNCILCTWCYIHYLAEILKLQIVIFFGTTVGNIWQFLLNEGPLIFDTCSSLTHLMWLKLNWCDSGCWEWLLSAWWFYQDIISKPLQLLTDFNRSQLRFFLLDILQYCNILWETCWQTQCETAINQLWGDPPRHFFTSLRANTENVKRSKGRESRKNSTHSRGERSLTRVPTLVEVTCKVEEYCVTFSSGYNLMKVFYAFFLPVSNIFLGRVNILVCRFRNCQGKVQSEREYYQWYCRKRKCTRVTKSVFQK